MPSDAAMKAAFEVLPHDCYPSDCTTRRTCRRHRELALALDAFAAEAVAAERAATVPLIQDLLKVYEALMPGIRYIAVPDYSILNDVPIAACRWLEAREEGER